MRFLTIIVFLLTISATLDAQDSVVYWRSECPSGVQSRLLHGSFQNGDLYLAGRASDFDYRNPILSYYRFGTDLSRKSQACFTPDSLHEIRSFYFMKNGNLRFHGSAQADGKLSPFIVEIDKYGNKVLESKEISAVPKILGPSCVISKKEVLSVSSQQTQNGVFNCKLEWLDYKNNNKLIRSYDLTTPFNEECHDIAVDKKGNIYLLVKRYKSLDYKNYASSIYKIDVKGHLKWTIECAPKSNFESHAITLTPEGNILYGAGIYQSNAIFSYSELQCFNPEGKQIKKLRIPGIQMNAITPVLGGGFLISGSSTKNVNPLIIKKASIAYLNSEFLLGKQSMLGKTQAPDKYQSKEIQVRAPSSSEYYGAVMDKEGNAYLFGRVYFNQGQSLKEILDSPRYNWNMLVKISPSDYK